MNGTMKKGIVIETPRLIIRDFLITDWVEVHAYSADPETVQYLDWGPNSEEETINFILTALSMQRDNPRTTYHFALIQKPDGPLIGSCSLYMPDMMVHSAVIGYVINREFREKGYATEALIALLEFGFETLREKKIEAICDVRNSKSARVLEKAGFRRQKTLIKHKMRQGIWTDSYLYTIGNAKWNLKCKDPEGSKANLDFKKKSL